MGKVGKHKFPIEMSLVCSGHALLPSCAITIGGRWYWRDETVRLSELLAVVCRDDVLGLTVAGSLVRHWDERSDIFLLWIV